MNFIQRTAARAFGLSPMVAGYEAGNDRNVGSTFTTPSGTTYSSPPRLQSAGTDTRDSVRRTVAAKVKDALHNHPLVSSGHRWMLTHLVGDKGLMLQVAPIGDLIDSETDFIPDFTRKIEKLWQLAIKRGVSSDGATGFQTQLSQLVSSYLTHGETLAVVTAPDGQNPTLQVLDPTQLRDPGKMPEGRTIHNGIEYNGRGEIVAYYIHNRPIGATVHDVENDDRWTRIPRKNKRTGRINVIHCHNGPAGANRGVSDLAPIVCMASMGQAYQAAALRKANVEAQTAMIVYSDGVDAQQALDITGHTTPDGVKDTDLAEELDRDRWYQSQGEIFGKDETTTSTIFLAENDRAQVVQPSQSSLNLDSFAKSEAIAIAGAFGCDITTLRSEQGASSYSAARMVSRLEHKRLRQIAEKFIFPVIRAFFENWLLAQILQRPLVPADLEVMENFDALSNVQLRISQPPQIDPVKDAQAKAQTLENNLGTLTQILEEDGLDLEETLERRRYEHALQVEYGIDKATLNLQSIVSRDGNIEE